MPRRHGIEIHEQAWCPGAVRDGVTDFLQFSANLGDYFALSVPLLRRGLARSRTRLIVDLCSGAGGPWPRLYERVAAGEDEKLTVLLTDRQPNARSMQLATEESEGGLRYLPEPVDARLVPPQLAGFRTLFHSFHHFRPREARAILQDAVNQGQGIAIFETTERRSRAYLTMLFGPFYAMVTALWMRPFRWSRAFWTFVVPLIPIAITFDGIVSCLRSYSPFELELLIAEVDARGYEWEIGHLPIPSTSLLRLTYLMGLPPHQARRRAAPPPAPRP